MPQYTRSKRNDDEVPSAAGLVVAVSLEQRLCKIESCTQKIRCNPNLLMSPNTSKVLPSIWWCPTRLGDMFTYCARHWGLNTSSWPTIPPFQAPQPPPPPPLVADESQQNEEEATVEAEDIEEVFQLYTFLGTFSKSLLVVSLNIEDNVQFKCRGSWQFLFYVYMISYFIFVLVRIIYFFTYMHNCIYVFACLVSLYNQSFQLIQKMKHYVIDEVCQ